MSRHALPLVPVLLICLACLLAGCPQPQDKSTPGAGEYTPPPGSKTSGRGASQDGGELTVFAAASLTECLDEFATGFEAQQQGTRVKASYAGTQELLVQLKGGAKCDVFASASRGHMEEAVEAGVVTDARELARNKLCVVTDKKGGKVKTLKDLATEGVRVVVAVDTCPAGKYTRKCWEKMAGTAEFGADFVKAVERNVVSEETNVKLVVSKVELGEADAAFVYISDAKGVDVGVVKLPEEIQVEATYMVGVGKEAPQPELAEAYIDSLLGPEGKRCLEAAGLEAVAAADAGNQG